MKTIRLLLAAIVLAACSFSASAGEIFRFGPRIGTEVNSMRLNSDVFNSDNRAGFTGGLMMEVNVPLVGIAFDLSVMYVHRLNNNSLKAGASDSPDQNSMLTADSYIKRDYIEIPLNFKYKIGLPIVGKVVSPYLFTGPSFAFLASKRHINVAWYFGVGLQLFTHLQVGASYGLGITKTVEKVSSITAGPEITGRNNYWTVTAAWLF